MKNSNEEKLIKLNKDLLEEIKKKDDFIFEIEQELGVYCIDDLKSFKEDQTKYIEALEKELDKYRNKKYLKSLEKKLEILTSQRDQILSRVLKSDVEGKILVPGRLVKTRNSNYYLIHTTGYLVGKEPIPLNYYTEKLEHKVNKELDIVEVFDVDTVEKLNIVDLFNGVVNESILEENKVWTKKKTVITLKEISEMLGIPENEIKIE